MGKGMAYLQGRYPILLKRQLTDTVFDFVVSCPEIAAQAVNGQFVHIRVDGFFLRRPISICGIDRGNGSLRLVLEARGEGTKALSALREGDLMDIIGPLGNGFPALPPDQPLIVVGGGIGTPPMLGAALAHGKNTTAIIGFRGKGAVILEPDFQAGGIDTRVATDDGSCGYHGFVTGLLEQRLAEGPASAVYACGPMAMLKGVVAIAQAHGVPSQVSLEERMGCGVGACLVCACRTVRGGAEIFSHVCKDGPVFNGEEVVFE